MFAGAFIVAGSVGEAVIDLLWLAMRLSGRGADGQFVPPDGWRLRSRVAILIPCWDEAAVIDDTLRRCSRVWPDPALTIFVGCYPNDPATQAAVRSVAATDSRIRPVVLPHPGKTTKADNLNALWAAAMAAPDPPAFVVLHDAEDIVHADALALIEQHLTAADFVQLPVLPLIRPEGRLVSGHYADEFSESHGKGLVVRDWLRTSLPAAGVGCAFRTEMLRKVASARGSAGPFAPDSLTEDYELGLLIGELGGTSRFVRTLDREGKLIATREYFPHTFADAVRQKARWLGGIAFQSWDRAGWGRSPLEAWMRWRDRRGPLNAVVAVVAYLYLLIACLILIPAHWFGRHMPGQTDWTLQAVALVGFLSLVWRAVWRFGFTTAAYGLGEGLIALPRMVVGNAILIASCGRAIPDYVASLRGRPVRWDKTAHLPPPLAAEAAE